jgi:hypothetical protein
MPKEIVVDPAVSRGAGRLAHVEIPLHAYNTRSARRSTGAARTRWPRLCGT